MLREILKLEIKPSVPMIYLKIQHNKNNFNNLIDSKHSRICLQIDNNRLRFQIVWGSISTISENSDEKNKKSNERKKRKGIQFRAIWMEFVDESMTLQREIGRRSRVIPELGLGFRWIRLSHLWSHKESQRRDLFLPSEKKKTKGLLVCGRSEGECPRFRI